MLLPVRVLLVLAALGLSFSVASAAQTEPQSPAEFHRELAAQKAAGLAAARAAFGPSASSLEQLNYDVTYYDLDIQILEAIGEVRGSVYMEARSLINSIDQFDVDLYFSMAVDSVRMDGAPVSFSHVGDEVFITPPAPLDSGAVFGVTIYYHGNPASGGFGAFGFNTQNGYPMIWSLSEPYFARNWWPCKDSPSDKADSVDIHITCRDDLFASSNGLLVGETDNGNGTKTYDWHHGYPITTYLVSVAVTNYVRFDFAYKYNGGADSMPVYLWVYPSNTGSAWAGPQLADSMLVALSQYYGPYPFLDEKYAVSQFPWGGGMEHQTNTSQGGFSTFLNIHELAHQWWGDMVTCANWGHIWLNEGFASWSEALYQEWMYGDAAYRSYMRGMRYTGGGTVFCDDTTSTARIFNSGLSYDKGAWVLHMLRGVLGDADFFAALAEYRKEFEYKSATTEDFRDACEAATGRDLDWFFSEWVYGHNYPIYQYAYRSIADGDQYHVVIKLLQVQTTSPSVFTMPVQIGLTNGIDDTLFTVWNNSSGQIYDVYLPFQPGMMTLDPNDWILKSASPVDFGMVIESDTLKPAYRNYPYEDTLVASNGTPPYYWFAVDPSELPLGFTLDVTGVLHGITFTEDTYNIEVRVYSSGSEPSTRRFVTLVVNPPKYPSGDFNHDGTVRADDIVNLVSYLYRGGPPPDPLWLCDVNLSCTVDTEDIVYLVNYVFRDGPAPFDGCVM